MGLPYKGICLKYRSRMPNVRANRKIAAFGAGGLYREWALGEESRRGAERGVTGVPLQDAKSERAIWMKGPEAGWCKSPSFEMYIGPRTNGAVVYKCRS